MVTYSKKMATTVKQTTHAEDKLKIINDLLISACNQCLKKQTRKSNANRIKQETKIFDENCYRKKKELNRLGKLMCKSPNNVDIRNSYHNAKKNYRHMLRTNLRSQKERKLERLHSLGSKSTKEKWKIIKSIINDVPDIDHSKEIPNDDWISFFRSLGFNETLDNESDIKNNKLTPFTKLTSSDKYEIENFLNKDISTQEISLIGNKLKTIKQLVLIISPMNVSRYSSI